MQILSASISLSSGIGFLGLCAYCLTLLPTCTRIILPKACKTAFIKKLTQYRRQIGVSVFFLSLLHGGVWIYTNGINMFQWEMLAQSWHGLSCLGIFSLLAITSNNWSIKTMKKRWKQLHQLTYVALFILTVHTWEKTAYRWSMATPFSRGILICCIALVCLRFYWQWYKKKQLTAKKAPTIPGVRFSWDIFRIQFIVATVVTIQVFVLIGGMIFHFSAQSQPHIPDSLLSHRHLPQELVVGIKHASRNIDPGDVDSFPSSNQ